VEARTNAVLLERAERVVVVADSSKFGRVLPGAIAPVGAVHIIVTDDGITTEMLAGLRALGIDVVIA
jgi:DeoR family transcriptional regulator of aga operon